MSAPTSSGSLTGADLKDNLHDIQDNVVAPILMRYGRHIFVKFPMAPRRAHGCATCPTASTRGRKSTDRDSRSTSDSPTKG